MARLLRGEIRHASIEYDSHVVGHEQGNPRPALILSQRRIQFIVPTGDRRPGWL